MWRSEDQLGELLLFIHHGSPGGAQVIRRGSCSCQVSSRPCYYPNTCLDQLLNFRGVAISWPFTSNTHTRWHSTLGIFLAHWLPSHDCQHVDDQMCEYSVKKAILRLLAGITPITKDGARTQSAKQPMGIEDEELATWVMETDVEP